MTIEASWCQWQWFFLAVEVWSCGGKYEATKTGRDAGSGLHVCAVISRRFEKLVAALFRTIPGALIPDFSELKSLQCTSRQGGRPWTMQLDSIHPCPLALLPEKEPVFVYN